MTQELSEKIKLMSLILIIFVVIAHGYLLNVEFINIRVNASSIDTFIETFFSDGITSGAMGLFFLISGYLFFYNINKYNSFIIFYKYKLFGRINSLLIPYLFWSILWILIILILQSLPFAGKFIQHPVSISNYYHTLYQIIFNPIPHQLWFVRELFILVLFSPLIYFLLSCIKQPYIKLGILSFLLVDYLFLGYYSLALHRETLLFFFIGAFLGLNNLPDKFKMAPSKKIIYLWTILWAILLITGTILKINSHKYFIFTFKLSVLIGVFELWYLYDLVPQSKLKVLLPLSEFTFLIFVAHSPIIVIFKKGLLYYHLPPLLVYFVSPILTIYIIVKLGRLIRAHCPKPYVVMAGGR